MESLGANGNFGMTMPSGCNQNLITKAKKNYTLRIYYDNGKLSEEHTYKEGKEDGSQKYYQREGYLSKELLKENGELVLYKTYHSNGKLYSEMPYKDGKKNGKSVIYYPNGKITEEGTYKNNRKEGVWKYYNQAGRLTSEETYDHDNVVKTVNYN